MPVKAQKMQSAIAMQHQQLAEMQKADVMSQQFQLDMANKGITIAPFMDPHTGKMHPLAYDPLTKRLYNPFLDRNVKDTGAGIGGEWANLGTNGFPDSKKILSDANSFTEKELGPMPKDPGEKQNEWLDLRKRRFDGIVREFNEARAGQINPQSQPAQPPMQPQQQAAQPPAPQAAPKIPDNDPSIAALRKRGFSDEQVTHYKNMVDGISELTMKAQQTGLNDKERADLNTLIRNLESYRE
jgi:hypothetical protein